MTWFQIHNQFNVSAFYSFVSEGLSVIEHGAEIFAQVNVDDSNNILVHPFLTMTKPVMRLVNYWSMQKKKKKTVTGMCLGLINMTSIQ